MQNNPVPRSWLLAASGCLVLAVGLVFGQTLWHDFVDLDDNEFVYTNPHVNRGLALEGIRWALTDGPFHEWYPLASISHMINCQLFGLVPAWHYFTNLVIHATSSVLLLLALLRMTNQRAVPEVAQASGGSVAPAGPSAMTFWPCLWVAMVFAIHPLHVSSVAWISERRELLAGLFFMLTLYTYTRYTERRSLVRYAAVFVSLALGLLSKSSLVTVPFVLLLLDYWPLGRFESPIAFSKKTWGLVVEKLPLLAIALLNSAMTLMAHRRNPAFTAILPQSLPIRIANALISCAAYVRQSFWPVGLSPYYPHLGPHTPMAWAAESLLLLLAISAVALFFWRRWPFLPVGWFWFLGMLVPVLGLVGNFVQSRADNYTYLSQIGLSIAVAWSVWTVYGERQASNYANWRTWTLVVGSAAAVLSLAVVAWRQTSYWASAETFWTRAVACFPDGPLGNLGLGNVYINQGKIEEAVPRFEAVVAAYSSNRYIAGEAHARLADCLKTLGRSDEELAHLEAAVRILPESPLYHALLAIALESAGKPDQARAEWQEAINQGPQWAPGYVGLAIALLRTGDSADADQAIVELERAAAIESQDALLHLRLALALLHRGRTQDALAELGKAAQLGAGDPQILWRTAWVLSTNPDPAVRNGRLSLQLARRAVEISQGRDPRALDALAAGLAEAGNFEAAVNVAKDAATLAQDQYHDHALASAIGRRQETYRDRKAYREPTRSGPESMGAVDRPN